MRSGGRADRRSGGQADRRSGGQAVRRTSLLDYAPPRPPALNRLSLRPPPSQDWGMRPYERFDAWKACDELAHAVYDMTERWTDRERYQLIAQIRRAAVSAATNIVEGSTKRGRAEFHRYLQIAIGSLAEVGYLIGFAKRRRFVPETDFIRLERL